MLAARQSGVGSPISMSKKTNKIEYAISVIVVIQRISLQHSKCTNFGWPPMKSESPIISQIAAKYFVVATENKFEFLLSSLGFLLVFDRIFNGFSGVHNLDFYWNRPREQSISFPWMIRGFRSHLKLCILVPSIRNDQRQASSANGIDGLRVNTSVD